MSNKTIAQFLNVKKFPFTIKNSQGKEIYYETSMGYWERSKYDSQGNEIYYENSKGDWFEREFDSQGNKIYYEDSNGKIINNRPKVELTLEEIAQKFGIKVIDLKIKK